MKHKNSCSNQTVLSPTGATNGAVECDCNKSATKPFYELLPSGRMLFHIDNYRLQNFSTCPQLFDYTQLQNWRGKGKSRAISIGLWWARVLELIYNEMSHNVLPGIDTVIKFADDAWIDHDMEVNAVNFKFSKEDAIVMILDYSNKFLENDFKNWKIIATESGFGLKDEVMVGENNEVIVYYTGRPDLVLCECSSGKVIICDHKTVDYIQGNTIIEYKPHAQTAGYVIAAQEIAKQLNYPDSALTDRCIVNVCGRKSPSEKPRDGVVKPRFVRAYPNYSPEELEEWRQGVLRKCSQIKHMLLSGEVVRHENSCHIYGGCGFRRVCSVPPSVRDIVLKADFVKVPGWAPYDVEESE